MNKGIYQHFKGSYYQVLDTAIHSESEELHIIYKPLYGEGKTWVRPVSLFNDKITRHGNTLTRFTYICEASKENLAKYQEN